MADIKKGYYENKEDGEDVVRSIYFPSFEDEVVIEDFNGIMKCWNVPAFLVKYEETDKRFKPKLERVKDGRGLTTRF